MKYFLLLFLVISPALSQEIEVEADYIQAIYSANFDKHLDRLRSLIIAENVNKYCEQYEYSIDWALPQYGYESHFGNYIRDMEKPFNSWSYGYTGIQISTAQQCAKRDHILKPITGRALIEDYRLNIRLGCSQMGHLIKLNHSLKLAIRAYNVGERGMRLGNGSAYYDHIKQARARWLIFKKRDVKTRKGH